MKIDLSEYLSMKFWIVSIWALVFSSASCDVQSEADLDVFWCTYQTMQKLI